MAMNKKEKKAGATLLDELYFRFPKTSRHGFLPTQEVKDSIQYLLKKISDE